MAKMNCSLPSASDMGNNAKRGAQSVNVLNAVAIPAAAIGGIAGGTQDVVTNLTLVIWRGLLNSAAGIARPFGSTWRQEAEGTLASLGADQWSHAGEYAQGTWAAVMPTSSSNINSGMTPAAEPTATPVAAAANDPAAAANDPAAAANDPAAAANDPAAAAAAFEVAARLTENTPAGATAAALAAAARRSANDAAAAAAARPSANDGAAATPSAGSSEKVVKAATPLAQLPVAPVKAATNLTEASAGNPTNADSSADANMFKGNRGKNNNNGKVSGQNKKP